MSMHDNFLSLVGGVSTAEYAKLGKKLRETQQSLAVVLNRATGMAPVHLAAEMRRDAEELADIALGMDADIEAIEARLVQLKLRRDHVLEVEHTVAMSADAIEALPKVRFDLDPTVMGSDMPAMADSNNGEEPSVAPTEGD